jgi:transposase
VATSGRSAAIWLRSIAWRRSRARHRLKALLLRHGYRYEGRAAWTFRYRQWLSNLFPTAAQQIAFQECIDTIGEAERRVERLTEQIRELLPA